MQGLSTGIEKVSTYWFYAVALFGAAMTPYEVFLFSSGAVEEGWTVKDLARVPSQCVGRISTWWCAVTGDCRLCGRSSGCLS